MKHQVKSKEPGSGSKLRSSLLLGEKKRKSWRSGNRVEPITVKDVDEELKSPLIHPRLLEIYRSAPGRGSAPTASVGHFHRSDRRERGEVASS